MLDRKNLLRPDWYGSVGWMSSSKVKGHRFDSQSGHMPGLQVQSMVRVHTGSNPSMFLVTSPTTYMQLAPLQLLLPWWCFSEWVGLHMFHVGSLYGLFQETCCFFHHLNPPLIFTARSYKALFTLCCTPGLCCLAWSWDHLLPRSPFWFLSATRDVGPSIPLAAATTASLLLPHCVLSTPLTRLDE